jgi:hypothetical protein
LKDGSDIIITIPTAKSDDVVAKVTVKAGLNSDIASAGTDRHADIVIRRIKRW